MSDPFRPTTVEQAYSLVATEEPAKVEAGLSWLRAHAASRPEDAVAWYELGSGLDRADHEAEAMEAYERVFALGLDHLAEGVQPHLLLQAGSTLRNLGRLDESRALLVSAVTRYPEMRALRVFLALTEATAGHQRRAIDHLLATILLEAPDDGSVQDFRRAITWYAEHLWDDLPASGSTTGQEHR